jgi:hypothetical protein
MCHRPCHGAYCATIGLINRSGARLRQACPRARAYHRSSIGLPLRHPFRLQRHRLGPSRLPTRIPRHVRRSWSRRCTDPRPAATPPLLGVASLHAVIFIVPAHRRPRLSLCGLLQHGLPRPLRAWSSPLPRLL